MRNFRWTALLLSVLMSGIPAAYAQTVVHKIGVSPLLGTSSSTPEIRQKIADNPQLVRSAAYKVGLSRAEYDTFLHKFNTEKPGWVTIPRHLDAMSWASDGEAHAIYDVQIPAGTNGWQVDLYEPHQIVHVYIPMVCGNISVVKQPRHPVAVRPALPHFVAPPPPVVIATPVPAPVPLVAAQAPAEEIPPVAPPVVHHPHLLLPILAGAAIAALIIGGNHHHGSNTSTPPNGGTTVITPPSLPNVGTVTVPNIPIVIPPPSGSGGCGCPT